MIRTSIRLTFVAECFAQCLRQNGTKRNLTYVCGEGAQRGVGRMVTNDAVEHALDQVNRARSLNELKPCWAR